VSALAVVSWPARTSVITSSRTQRSSRARAPSDRRRRRRVGRGALGVARGEEQGEQVVARRRAARTRGEHRPDARVEARARGDEGARAGRGQALQPARHGQEERIPEQGEPGVEVGTHVVHRRRVRVAEQRLADDAERQRHHRLAQREHLAVAPRRRPACRVRSHDGAVAGEPVAVEGGLQHAPLPAVRVALRLQQPVADDAAHGLEGQPTEVALPGDEHLAHRLGMGEQPQPHRPRPEARRVAALGRQGGERAQRVAAEGERGEAKQAQA
jgi:hypothetical protein